MDIWGEKIKEVLGFDLKMHYGQVEKVSFMYQSNMGNNYHESLTYSYTEYDEENVIVGTSFMNYVMPFIRYKTNDIATLINNPVLNTSTPLTVKEIDGRVDDMVVSESNSKIPSVNFYTVMSKCEDVKMFQLYQKMDKSLEMKLIFNTFSNKTLTHIKKEIKQRVGDLPLTFNIVDEIPRDVNTGKLRCVITEIK